VLSGAQPPTDTKVLISHKIIDEVLYNCFL